MEEAQLELLYGVLDVDLLCSSFPSGGLCAVGGDGERRERRPVYIAFAYLLVESAPVWAMMVPSSFAEEPRLVYPGGDGEAAAA